LEKVLVKIEREEALKARKQLKQHTIEHGCDGFPSPVE
jgi:hypothetical protein